ncbi:glycosyltransferase family 2 protein [Shimia biformata]|uniref:glycosyltransferase family 2 protein n=1 Tax=Shimia biformata TaxID=1294299 RepID=UPI00194F5DD1|nr:glycosyltransferase family 2 protein [Shimia biformata]
MKIAAASQIPHPKTALVASMRNEGIFILEWVAYHLEIGFDRVVICSNNCTDGSDRLLDALDAAGFVTHLRADPASGQSPQDAGMAAAMEFLAETDTEWLCHLDSDEFLHVRMGGGHVDDLLDRAGEGDVIALAWRNFGDSGQLEWAGAVLPVFTQCEGHPDPETVKFKSMFRFRKFEHANEHMPLRPKVDDIAVLNAVGNALTSRGITGPRRSRYVPVGRAMKPNRACINHYAVKSVDVFLMKNDRGDGQGKTSDKYHLGSSWHHRANRNDVENRRILRHWNGTEARIAAMRQNPDIARTEQDCITWFRTRREAVLTDKNLAAWTAK